MDETELRFFLAGIYRHLREIRSSQFELQKMASATRLALKEVPGFEERYAEHWVSVSAQLDRQLASALQHIDEIVQKLEEI